ncbi:MAG: type IV pilus modification PilV family protein [Planctomycetota bacterium]
MSAPALQAPGRRAAAAGYSLIELVISSALLAMMIFAVSTLSLSGSQAQEYSRRLTRVTEITQEVVDDMRLELVSSVRLFSDDVEGNGNLELLDLDGAPPPLASSRLPTVSAGETIRTDTSGAEMTGNSLFFTKLVWSDRYICESGAEHLVDVYRWVYYYLTVEGQGPQPEHPIGLNIVRVESEPLIDGASVDRITDADDRAEVLLHLLNATPDATGAQHAPAEVVWIRGGLPTVSGTLRQVDPLDGSLTATPLLPRPNPWRVLRADPITRGLLSYRHHSIATNFAQPSFGVATFGLRSSVDEGFPHGLEVQVVGPSSARQVHLHMVVSSTQRTGRFAWADLQLTVDARDL